MKIKTLLLTACTAALALSPLSGVFAESAEVAPNMFGGASYQGEPALAVTSALVKAGGGADDFSFAKALVNMLGQDTVEAEIAKLNEQYGEEEVKTFIEGMDLAIAYSLKRAGEAGIALPAPADLSGQELAKTLVQAGTTPDGTFWSGYLFDKAISHTLHNQVMGDINVTAGYEADKTTHKILNQAMYDVAQALGMKDVKLAALH
ncbi:MAG: hypothetical protein WC997_01360 [Porticoccaceae bacterium]